MPLTEQEKREAIQYALNGADFMFVPTLSLSQKVAKGHPRTTGINAQLKIHIMEKKNIRLAAIMIMEYCKNKLSENNTWLLDQGDIKVIPKRFELENKGEN